MTAGAVTALTFWNVKQITIKESLDCTVQFPCESTALALIS